MSVALNPRVVIPTLGGLLIALIFGVCQLTDDDSPSGSGDASGSLPAATATPTASTATPAAATTSAASAAPSEVVAASTCERKDGRDEAADALVPLSTVVLRITEGGSPVREFTYDEFADFTFECIDASAGSGRTDDANQSGPQLVDLIDAAGFASWSEIEISGVVTTNNDIATSATVSFAEASQGWLLTIDKSGQVRFPDPRGSGRADWVSMISEVAVTP